MAAVSSRSILWFRNDLRLADHPALSAAAKADETLCVFIFDEESRGLRAPGAAARWWLHHSLASLSRSLEERSGRLDILSGDAEELLVELASAAKADAVYWTRRYGEGERALDERVEKALRAKDIQVQIAEGGLLHRPEALKTKAGTPFRVYTPFFRTLRERVRPDAPIRAPTRVNAQTWPRHAPKRVSLAELGLEPGDKGYARGLAAAWRPGEESARDRLEHFINDGLGAYSEGRDVPSKDATSRLSPHLRSGEISPRQLWAAINHASERENISSRNTEKFLSELGWREFSYHLLFHNPRLEAQNFNPSYDAFPWRKRIPDEIEAWRRGETGYPIVDAGMRELARTGYMHNRVRLITASFLVKDLLADWRTGEAWFWDSLCDADPANNPSNWQWSAGSGADAAPYFRVFNPVLQSKKFDPSGAYIRIYVPELGKLPDKWIHEPWRCPKETLEECGIELGKTYPQPLVDHDLARRRALDAFQRVKNG